MGVTSITFIYFFLPVVIIAYFAAPGIRAKNYILLFTSLFFYAWGDINSIWVLVSVAVLDYMSGLVFTKIEKPALRSTFLAASVLMRIGILAGINLALYYKFEPVDGYFLFSSIPIGLSFLMFRSISYVSEIYLEIINPTRNFADYLFYLSFFPVIIAGPIVRYSELEEEMASRKFSALNISNGLVRISTGLIKKIIIADSLEPLTRQFLTVDPGSGSLSLLFGLIIFSLQIYYDFSGYTDIVIGIASLFGFTLPENFSYPYFSRSVSEFWRRWHITLGSFFRDFVFIPLSLVRSKFNIIISLAVVWSLTGLWHGFTLNFLLWGIYFGIFIAAEIYLLKRFLPRLPVVFQHFYLLLVVVAGWSLFYFRDMDKLTEFYRILLSFQPGSIMVDLSLQQAFITHLPVILVALVFVFPVGELFRKYYADYEERFPSATYGLRVIFTLAALFFSTALLLDRSFNPFLYGGF